MYRGGDDPRHFTHKTENANHETDRCTMGIAREPTVAEYLDAQIRGLTDVVSHLVELRRHLPQAYLDRPHQNISGIIPAVRKV